MWGKGMIDRLLHLANAAPPIVNTREFYAVKDRLLRARGELLGHEWQHIADRCWGPWNCAGCPGATCYRCGGTGIYRQKWVRLERWRLGRHIFHRPIQTSYADPGVPVTIVGRIHHQATGRRSHEALFWLYALTGEWRLFWYHMWRGGACCGWYAWPFLSLQRVVFHARLRLGRIETCLCGRKFWRRGGWCVCPRCRHHEGATEEVPW